MSARPDSPAEQSRDTAPPSSPQTPPRDIGYGHPEYQFVQSVMQMQQALGEIKASIDNLRQTVDSTKSKIDDLVAWKNRILGGAIALGAVCALIGFLVTKFSSYVTISVPHPPAVQAPAAPISHGDTTVR